MTGVLWLSVAACLPLGELVSATCGDGAMQGEEGCDEGIANADMGACTTLCQPAACGDGNIFSPAETCDDTNTFGGDGCTPHCSMPATVDLGAADATLVGEAAADNAGHSVAFGGDLDGDGTPDLIVGAWGSDRRDLDAGSVYLLAQVEGVVSLATAAGVVDGLNAADELGFSVAAEGDTVWVGAPGRDGSYGDVGAVFRLGLEPGAVGLDAEVLGTTTNGRLGTAVASVGDVDGDGASDVLAGAPSAAAAYVLLTSVLAPGIPADVSTAGAVYIGQLGTGVAVGAGDLDGDGVIDATIGNVNSVSVVYGPLSGSVPLAAADAERVGDGPGDGAGAALAVGDLNGDGLEDLVVGAPFHANGGAAHVVFGPVTGTSSLASADVRCVAEGFEDELGASLAVAPDVDANGAEGLLIGAPFHNSGWGAAYRLDGPLIGTLDMSDADVRFTTAAPYQRAGWSVAAGARGALIGAPYDDAGGESAGAAMFVASEAP